MRVAASLIMALVLAASGSRATAALIEQADRCERGSRPPDAGCLTTDQRSFFGAVDFVNREVAEDAVFYSWKAEPFFLYTGRLTVDKRWAVHALKRIDDVGFEPLAAAGVTHVLLTHLHPGELEVAVKLERHCSRLQLLAVFKTALVFQMARAVNGEVAPEELAETPACRALADYLRASVDAETGESLLDFNSEWPPP